MTKAKRKLIAKPGPGYEGRYELGSMIVDDPYEAGAKLTAQVNRRHDVLLHWKARKQIDDAQFMAGQKLQAIWYRAQIGRVGSCVPSNDRVDTPGASGPDFWRIAKAGKDLSEVAIFLGARDYGLIIKVVCEGHDISTVAGEKRGDREGTAWVVRRALSDLADYWSATGLKSLPITAFHATL